MGIVESDLASFELSTFGECRIEQNADGAIHVHLGGLRLELSRAEFDEFAAVVERGRTELREVKSDSDSQ